MKYSPITTRALMIDDAYQSARRLQEYRERCEKLPESVERGDDGKLRPIASVMNGFFRKPLLKRRKSML